MEIQASKKRKLNLKRNSENILQDIIMSKQSRISVDEEAIDEHSRLINEEEVVDKQSQLDKNSIIKQRRSVDTQCTINQSNLIKQEKVISMQRRLENKKIMEKNNAKKNTPESTSIISTSNIVQLLEDLRERQRKDDNNKRQYAVNDKKAKNSTAEKKYIRKKIGNKSIMQLKLFLLECNRKLEDGFKVFYISNVTNANEVTDAIFSFEKMNTRNLFQVNYYLQERRLNKKIYYKTLKSPDFIDKLSTMFRIFKENKDINRIILYSNLELDKQSLKRMNIGVRVDESMGTCHLELSEESDFFKKMIEKHSGIPKLAQYLDQCMWKATTGKKVTLKGTMKKYHSALITENVIIVTENEGRNRIGKLHPDFIKKPDNMLKPAIVQLRRHLKSLNGGVLRIDGKLLLNENFGRESSSQNSQTENLLQKLAIEETMKKFFDKLEFMECEKNLDFHIRRELGDKFRLIQSDFHIKVVKKELFTRLRPGRDQTDLFKALERKILSFNLPDYQQNKNSMKVILEFESDALENLKTILTQANKSTIVIKSNCPSLCASKIQQVMKSLDKYKENQYSFLHVDDLLSVKNNIFARFSTQSEHLLVIQTEGANLKSEQLDCLNHIRKSISNDPKGTNKVVLIQNISNSSFNFYIDVAEFKEIFNSKTGLTKVSQYKLSEMVCEFSGSDDNTYAATLKDLFLDPSDMTDLLASAQCVDKLVKGNLIIGEKLLKPFMFISTFIMPRYLKRHVVVNSAVLKEESQDIFFLFGDEKESKINKVHYFKDFDSAFSSFEQFISQNKKINAHILEHMSIRGSNQLIWHRSNGSMRLLMKYLLEDAQAVYQSDPISDVLTCRIMILCGKSGTGKSLYLFKLAQRLQSSNQNLEHWVIQLNLNNSLLGHYINSQLRNANDAVDVLTKILGYDELRQRLFRLGAFGKLKLKLSLFVDGLENLQKNNANLIYRILHLLIKTKIKRIYVTARPKFKKILEEQLNDFAYSIDPLSQDEQKALLASTWNSLANHVFTDFAWNNHQNELLDICNILDTMIEPLYLNIFALVFWFCVWDGQKVPAIQKICDIYKAYSDKFINCSEQSRNKFFHESLKRLLHPDDFRKLNISSVRSSKDFAELNHSSFAEYGAAIWLASLPLQEQIEAFNIMEDLAERTSIIFFETFAHNCNEHYLVYINQIGDNRLVVQFFTDHLWDKADDCQQQEYLQEAVRTNRVKLSCELMLKSTEIKLSADLLMPVADYVIAKLLKDKPTKSHPYWSLNEKLLLQVPEAAARMDSDVQLAQLLDDLFARGSYEVVSKIFQSIGDRKKEERILRTRVDGCKPLEIVNSSALMTDEQRLAISKFLIRRNDSENNVYSVISAAARHGHTQTFEFFAGKSSKMRSNFLKKALKSNQLDILEFLLDDTDRIRDYDLVRNYPLHAAVTERVSPKTLEFLLSYGGVNNKNRNGETALCVAIKNGVDLRIIKLLVKKGADVNAKDKQGLHAWCYAVLNKCYNPQQQLELVQFLKNEKYKLLLPEPDDYQLDCSIKEIKRKFEYLWEPENYDLNYYKGTPRLHIALIKKDNDWLKFLLQHGADPDALDSQKRMALHLAVKLEKGSDVFNAVKLLLRAGATFNARDADGETPLALLHSSKNATDDKRKAYNLLRQATDLFIDRKHIEQLKKELSVNNINTAETTNLYWLLHSRDSDGRTLLHRAAERNLPLDDFLKLLQFFERFADKKYGDNMWLHTRDNSGETVVHVVARLNNYKVLRELARKGASLRMNNSKGMALQPRDSRSKKFLDLVNRMFVAVSNGPLETLRGIDKENIKYLVKVCNKFGCTMLHMAALGKSSVVHILLHEWNSNPNVVNHKGRTPLHCALMSDDLDSAKMLVKAGAHVDARDENGRKPTDLKGQAHKSVQMLNILNEILEKSWHGKLSATELDEKVKLLSRKFDLEPGASVNARDSRGNTMVHYAAHNHEPELLKTLLEHGAAYNACNASGKWPIDLANGEIKEMLLTVHKLFKHPKVAYWEVKKDVLDLEIMTRCRKSGGYTLLHTVLEAKQIEEAKWLMDRGADVNVTNSVGAEARKLAKDLQLIVE